MGLISAAIGAIGGTLADQWKEFFYCEAISNDVLVVKGKKQESARSSNTKGEDNIISNGSKIAVADGQAMIIVDQGKVVEFCAEPGEYIFDTSSEPSIFSGKFGESLIATFKTALGRFTYGGATGKDQRVYYFNTKEISDNKFGTATPIPFRVVINEQMGLKLSVDIRCNGDYSYVISDPITFYQKVCGNVTTDYKRSQIDAALKGSFMTALQPALGQLSAAGIQYYEISGKTFDVRDAINDVLKDDWVQKRGISIYDIHINSLSIPDDQRKKITEWEENAMTTNPAIANARVTGGTIDAMKIAANNPNGAMNGFIGMNMMQGAGGGLMNAMTQNQMQQPQVQQPQQQAAPEVPKDAWKCSCGAIATGKFCPECGSKKPEARVEGEWVCECGKKNTGKFCAECGKPKPTDADGWTCECGTVNKGKFCAECGKPKPAGAKLYKCDKCGWEPEDPAHPPKFCPECGDIFDDKDVK